MESVEFTRDQDNFTLVVRPTGWGDQLHYPALAVLSFYLAAEFTHALLHGFKINNRPAEPIEALYSIPLWFAGLAFLAVGIQRAYRKTVFTADTAALVIATSGPLRRTTRMFPRTSLLAAVVGNSQISVNGRALKQLQLFFAEHTAPYCLLTNRDLDDLQRVAQYLTGTIHSPVKPYSRDQFMEVRHAPIYESLFKTLCGVGVVVCFIAMALRHVIGDGVFAAIFFGTVLAIIVAFAIISRKCNCPQCNEVIKRDSMSAEGYYQYTCPRCRIVWQSPVRVGGERTL